MKISRHFGTVAALAALIATTGLVAEASANPFGWFGQPLFGYGPPTDRQAKACPNSWRSTIAKSPTYSAAAHDGDWYLNLLELISNHATRNQVKWR